MPRMKISGPIKGRLVFSYDIREGHIDYDLLKPALQKRLDEKNIKKEITNKDLEEFIGELLYKTNEKVFDNLYKLLSEGKFEHSDIKAIMDETINELFK